MTWLYLLAGVVVQFCGLCTAAYMGEAQKFGNEAKARGALRMTLVFLIVGSVLLFSAGIAWVQS